LFSLGFIDKPEIVSKGEAEAAMKLQEESFIVWLRTGYVKIPPQRFGRRRDGRQFTFLFCLRKYKPPLAFPLGFWCSGTSSSTVGGGRGSLGVVVVFLEDMAKSIFEFIVRITCIVFIT